MKKNMMKMMDWWEQQQHWAGLASSGVKTEVIQGVNHLEMSSNTSVQNYFISVIQELSRPSIVIVPIPLND